MVEPGETNKKYDVSLLADETQFKFLWAVLNKGGHVEYVSLDAVVKEMNRLSGQDGFLKKILQGFKTGTIREMARTLHKENYLGFGYFKPKEQSQYHIGYSLSAGGHNALREIFQKNAIDPLEGIEVTRLSKHTPER